MLPAYFFFKQKTLKKAMLLGMEKNVLFIHIYSQRGFIIENMGKVTASFCWYSCLKRNYGNQEKEY